MPDVFLSYSREDKAQADAIATAMTAAGYDVFWDHEIPPGATWADYLQEKILNAKALVVLWTATSTQSQWVREEARIGRDARKLLPVLLDGTPPPFGFGEVQAVDLSGWRGEPDNADWKRLLAGLTALVTQSGGQAPTPKGPPRAVNMPSAQTVEGGGILKVKPARWMLYAGAGLVAVFGIATLMPETPSNPGAPAPSQVQPNPTTPLAATPGAPAAGDQLMNPAVIAAVTKARELQTQGKQLAVQARANSVEAAKVAARARQGDPSLGQLNNNGSIISGDIATLQALKPAAVGVRNPDGSEFYGLMAVNSETSMSTFGSSTMAGARVDGQLYVQGEQATFVGAVQVTNKYLLEGSQRGSPNGAEARGDAVVTYANGERYEGEYRGVGTGAAGQILRDGFGILYAANGDVVSAGRFANDRYVGPE